MPHFNALFAWLWFHGFSKIVNMIQHLSPASGESFDVLFARKLQKADGSLSDVFVINANLMALLHYYVDCFFDASAPFRRDKKKNSSGILRFTWHMKRMVSIGEASCGTCSNSGAMISKICFGRSES